MYVVSMGVSFAVWSLTLTDLHYLPMMLIQIALAVVLYVIIYAVMGLPEYREIRQLCINRICRK